MHLDSVVQGENAVKFWLNSDVSNINVAFYARLRQQIKQGSWSWLQDVVAAESSVTVFFNFMHCDHRTVKRSILAQVQDLDTFSLNNETDLITLPVKYGGEIGFDLPLVAHACDLSQQEVIDFHQASLFTVTAVGFSPGFGYLKGLDKRLKLPRRDEPRTSVPKGAVAIAEHYTAVYPQESPGGWHIIGYCPENLFDINLPQPALFKVGQTVKFIAVD